MRAARAGDELLDLVEQRVGVAGEVDVVVAGQLEVARAGDVGGQVRPLATSIRRSPRRCMISVGTLIAGSTARMSSALIVSRIGRTIPGRTEWRSKWPHQRRKPVSWASVGASTFSDAPEPQPSIQCLPWAATSAGGRPFGIVGGLEPPRACAVEDQADAALGVGGREQRRHRTALGRAEQDRALGADGVHHRQHVVHPLLERLRGRDRVRQPAAALVEDDQPAERGEPPQEVRGRRVLPVLLDVRQPLRHQDHVDVAFADHLVGDAQLAGFCESGLR